MLWSIDPDCLIIEPSLSISFGMHTISPTKMLHSWYIAALFVSDNTGYIGRIDNIVYWIYTDYISRIGNIVYWTYLILCYIWSCYYIFWVIWQVKFSMYIIKHILLYLTCINRYHSKSQTDIASGTTPTSIHLTLQRPDRNNVVNQEQWCSFMKQGSVFCQSSEAARRNWGEIKLHTVSLS